MTAGPPHRPPAGRGVRRVGPRPVAARARRNQHADQAAQRL
jgi:hypothetical protein